MSTTTNYCILATPSQRTSSGKKARPRATILFPTGEKLPVKLIGKGPSDTVYVTVGRVLSKPKRVFVVAKDLYGEQDFSNEVVIAARASAKGLTHLPKVQFLGKTQRGDRLYEMPYYPAVRMNKDKAAWMQAKLLRDCELEDLRLGTGYKASQKILACVERLTKARRIPKALYRSLKAVVDVGAGYGPEYRLTFADRGVDAKGRLVLLEPIFPDPDFVPGHSPGLR